MSIAPDDWPPDPVPAPRDPPPCECGRETRRLPSGRAGCTGCGRIPEACICPDQELGR